MPEGRFRIALAAVHPVRAWRQFTLALADHADAQARAAGLTVEILPGGVRRYRDPRLDQLAAHRASQTARRCPSCGQLTAATPAPPVIAARIPAGWSLPATVDTGWSP